MNTQTAFEHPPVGSLAWSGYWQVYSYVLAHAPQVIPTYRLGEGDLPPTPTGATWVTEVDATGDDIGRVRTHCTPFRHARWDGDRQADRCVTCSCASEPLPALADHQLTCAIRLTIAERLTQEGVRTC